ncbi:thioredoxin domain-containing protein [Candidatus Roizmanbacteria bacterium]|nr:thioredoxin domain-containing protein [Candidatus Roizmanbacteria bacterium]
MKYKTHLIIAGSLVFLFLFLFGVYKLTNTTVDYKDVMTLSASDHVKWSPDKKHVLVEYSDLQCPACKAYHDIMSTFEASGSPNLAIPKQITLVFRHFPLYQIHENALEMAYGAEAASRQGKFFEMANVLFSDQDNLAKTKDPKGFLAGKAKAIGLNVDQFKNDEESANVKNKVNADLSGGERAGINGTPTFFLDGQKLEFQSPQEFVKILQAVLQ